MVPELKRSGTFWAGLRRLPQNPKHVKYQLRHRLNPNPHPYPSRASIQAAYVSKGLKFLVKQNRRMGSQPMRF